VEVSVSTLIYLAGMAVIYVGQRLLAGYDTLSWVLVLVGVGGVVAATALRVEAMRRSDDDGLRWGHRRMLDFLGISFVSLALYALSTDTVVQALGLEGPSADHFAGVFAAIWPIVWLIATIPLLVLDNTLQSSPVVIPRRHVSRAMWHGIGAATAIALMFPVNYLAAIHFERWDFSYFRTAKAGSATKQIVAQLEKPVKVRIFQPVSSEVTDELLDYFRPLKGKNLQVEVLDQAAQPELAKKLRVRDNGYIAISALTAEKKGGDAKNPEHPKVKRIRIGTELDRAKPKLKNLDQEVQKALLDVSRGKLTAYLTTGHGELSWKGRGHNPMRTLKGLKQILEYMNFRIKDLGLTEGLGKDVPDDADVVIVLDPQKGMLKSEVDALERYLKSGGAVILAVEPKMTRDRRPAIMDKDDATGDLLAWLGLDLGNGVLASTRQIVPLAHNKIDRLNIATDRFSSHPSTVVLSKNRGELKLFAPTSGWLRKTSKGQGDVTVTVRSLSSTWNDLDGDLEFEAKNGESRSSRPIAAAVTGKKKNDDGSTWRALVVSDASLFADVPIVNPGNQQFVYDGLNWLTRQEAISGSVKSEEDVKIQHTREGQAGWFYLTVIGIPVLLFGLGMLRVRLRRKEG